MEHRDRASGWQHAKLSGHKNEDLVKMRVVMKRAVHFITCNGKFFGSENPATIKNFLIAAENGVNYKQLSMFENGYSNVQTIISKRENNAALAALTGEL